MEYSGYIDLDSKETLAIKNLENSKSDYRNKYLSKIFNTNIHTDVEYFFDYSKALALFKDYEEKYGQPSELDKNKLTYHYWENGGVDRISDIEKAKIQVDDNGTFLARIILEAHGKKTFGWGNIARYDVELFKFYENRPNLVLTNVFTNTDLLYDFLSRLIECIVNINKHELIERINYNTEKIVTISEEIKNMSNILETPVK